MTSQQPGSPWCPQHLCPLEILIQLLRNSRYTFRWSGMGADILVKKDFILGITRSLSCVRKAYYRGLLSVNLPRVSISNLFCDRCAGKSLPSTDYCGIIPNIASHSRPAKNT